MPKKFIPFTQDQEITRTVRDTETLVWVPLLQTFAIGVGVFLAVFVLCLVVSLGAINSAKIAGVTGVLSFVVPTVYRFQWEIRHPITLAELECRLMRDLNGDGRIGNLPPQSSVFLTPSESTLRAKISAVLQAYFQHGVSLSEYSLVAGNNPMSKKFLTRTDWNLMRDQLWNRRVVGFNLNKEMVMNYDTYEEAWKAYEDPENQNGGETGRVMSRAEDDSWTRRY